MTALCERYQISRKSGYKWLARAGELRDRSRRPQHHPTTAVPGPIVEQLRALRQEFRWGPRKLRWLLERQGVTPLPARSTIARILKREGLIPPRPDVPGRPPFGAPARP